MSITVVPHQIAGEAEDGRPVRWTLSGDARLLAQGDYRDIARSVPPPPDWSV